MKTPSVFRRVSAHVFSLALFAAAGSHLCYHVSAAVGQEQVAAKQALVEQSRARLPHDKTFATRLAHAALDRTKHEVRYDPTYVNIPYPGGDVPVNTGVCTDEIIRAYRALGYDLQRLVHEDMKENFSAYPSDWKLTKPDKNIDHRRVLNLQTYFKRRGAQVPVTDKPTSYLSGDLITCTVPPNLPHIALVVPAPDGGERPWIVHNIGNGPQLEDRLFEFPLTGHYRWHPGDDD